MANKVMSLHDAVEKYVHDNDVLCFGGFTTTVNLMQQFTRSFVRERLVL